MGINFIKEYFLNLLLEIFVIAKHLVNCFEFFFFYRKNGNVTILGSEILDVFHLTFCSLIISITQWDNEKTTS